MKKLATLTLALAAIAIGGCSTGPRTVEHSAQARADLLDRLAPLAGTWEMTDEQGKKQVAIVSRVTSQGSVYCETMFPGSPSEMTNMYHMDGSSIILTHYCAMGNQPRMRCVSRKGNVFVFASEGGTNIAKGQLYMGQLTLTIVDNNHIRQEWTSFNNGKPSDEHNVAFDLWRKQS